MILDKYAKLEENKTSLKREALAGVTTFATMSYTPNFSLIRKS